MKLVNNLDTYQNENEGLRAVFSEIDECSSKLRFLGGHTYGNEMYSKSLVPLSKQISKYALENGKLVITIMESKVWPSCVDHNLLDVFLRSSVPEYTGDLVDGCHFLAVQTDEDEVASLIYIGMLFGWQFAIRSCSRLALVEFSNDQRVRFWAHCEPHQLDTEFERASGISFGT